MTLAEQAEALQERFRNLEAMVSGVQAAAALSLAFQNGQLAADLFQLVAIYHEDMSRLVRAMESGAPPAPMTTSADLARIGGRIETLLAHLRRQVELCEREVAEAPWERHEDDE